MIHLRPYQSEAINKAIDFFMRDTPEPSLIVLPTAWGKSILTAYVAANIPQYDKLLVVQPSKELLEQNFSKFVALCGKDAIAGIYSASFRKKEMERITYATIGSIKNLGSDFRQMGFTKMLIDEAHLYPRQEESMLGGFLKESGITQVLGITATPLKLEQFGERQGDRFDKWSELIMLTNPSPSGTFFKNILHVGQISEMTTLHYWSPLRYEIIPFDTQQLRLNSTGSEFAQTSIEESYALNNVRNNIFAALDYHTERRHCVVFVPSVEEAAILANNYPEASYVCGDTPKKEREAVINGFKNGTIRVLFNVSVVLTGFDYPKIDMIVFAMSTASVARYYQATGRGVRIDPDKEKEDCIIVDMGGNVERFGHVEDITFEKMGRWRMYGSGGRLLSGIPIDCMNAITKDDIERMRSNPNDLETLNFGKHKGEKIENIPMSYRKWLIKNRNPQYGNYLFDKVVLTMEDYIKDTTKEPPVTIVPNGKYGGLKMSEVPRGYLVWLYNSQIWNNCNDSLRRGIEMTYGGVPPHIEKKSKSKSK
jgi:DNA repair protein RadD